ncbi:uncharacterized protein LOC105699757 [Orussus abietinus]|uniref:uncharacterized protein LOC105699757 n=1 Tax=Orussus abietinus TaxID=222816 RepID=UPI0006256CBB|nr:uncharacterized protein LOC105699757 [Orussus abietinus]
MVTTLGVISTLIVLGCGAYAEVISDPAFCSRTKCIAPAEVKFKYQKDLVYKYKYNVDVSTNMGEQEGSGKGRNESTLHVDAMVSLHFSSPCEGFLRLKDVSVSHNRSSYNPEFPDRAGAEFKASVEEFILRFAFHDGQVQELCPHPKEPIWSLNLKRGVLSMFQNTMKRFDVDRKVEELDVNGICETQYKLHQARRTSLIIRKSKDIRSCVYRNKHLSLLQSTAYRSILSQSSKPFQQPLMKSKSECEIIIDHNVYERVVCTDSHMLIPLSNGVKAGAQTDTRAVLQLMEESPEIFDESDTKLTHGKRTNLLYDHASTPKPTHGELRAARDLVKSMCTLGAAEEMQERFSEMFTKFIHSARVLNYPSLSQLFSRANGVCKNGRKHILNALPFIGSNAAVNVMKDLIIKRYVNKEKANDWVTAFALIPRPDRETLLALAPLLDFQYEIPDAQFILSYSAVIHGYCSYGDRDCLQLEPVQKFIEDLERKLDRGCAPQSHTLSIIKQTLEALKAIGNMGIETESLLKKLKGCIDGVGGFLPMELRVAAIDAHRRLPSCEKTRDSFFLDYYRNYTLDTEIRIASYLQVMRCPNYNVIKIIKRTLQEEEVNQVGSFVWSYLTNILSSASPTRIEVQSLLTDKDLGNKFNSDMRKFSRNYDNSFFSDEYNIGANYQGNLIFSPKSYIPRSAVFNFTMDLFGESVNLFEVGAWMEGLEFYAESLFGPEGPFSEEKVGNHLSQLLRRFRSVPENDPRYWERVKRLPNVIDNNFDHPRIGFGFKIFGNELKYTMLNGDAEIRSALTSLNPWEKVKQILSGKEIHYENTAMFMDTSYVVPTTVGLPIRLDLGGSAACNFKLSGLLDSKNLINNGEMELAGNIMPSVSVDITGTMMVDAFYKSAGIKLRSNIYSSGAVQVHLVVQGTRLVRLSLGLPNQKIEVFSILTDVLLVSHNGAETKEHGVGVLIASEGKRNLRQRIGSVISNTTCSWHSLDRLIGLKLCTEYQFPNVTKNPNASYFILNGPTLFKISMIKADPTARSYLLEYKWEKTVNESVIKVAFDTPGSELKRELSATVSFDVKSRNVTVLLQSAGNSLIAKGTYKKSENETLIDVGLDINGTKHLDARVGYSKKNGNYGFTYSPKLYLAINSERIAELSGTIRNAQKNNVSQCDIDLGFQTKKLRSRVQGYILKRNVSLSGNVKLEYQLQGMPKRETLQLEASLINRSSKTLTHKAANFRLQSTAYPQLNVVISSWYQQALGHLELHAEVNSSPHLRDDRHKLTAQFVVTYSKAYFQNQGAKISAWVAVTKPIQNLDIKVGVNHFSLGPESKTHLLIRYAPGKEIVLIVGTVMPRGTMFSIEGHANLTIPNFSSMIIDARVHEKARKEYELDFAGTWFSGHNVTIRGTYSDRSSAAIVNHVLKLLLKSPSFTKDVIVNCKLYNDASDLKIDLYMEQLDMDKYALVLKHTTISPTRLVTYLEGRYKNSLYTIMTNIDLQREARAEIHLDSWRDVHLIVRGINEATKKEFGLEVKWDANRDPALKFATALQLFKFAAEGSNAKNVSAIFSVTYPGRLVTGSCLLAIRGRNNYVSDFRLDWSPEHMVQFTIDVDYNMEAWEKSFKLESQLLTPFEQWKRTSLNTRLLQDERQFIGNGSVYWQDSHHIILDFSGKIKEEIDNLEWNGDFRLVSTVHSIKWITANVTHKQSNKSMDSHLVIKYYPDKIVDARSLWILHKEAHDIFNLTGTVNLVSPLVNYRKGEMKCYLCMKPNWKFQGAANIDIDRRKYTANLIGDLTKFKESMLQLNVTTPLERYAFLRGRFGFSESERHLVAEVVSPSGPLGFEAIFQLFTTSPDFHVKLLLATPIDVLQRSLLVAKLNKREADFRVAYNNITAGFQGVWHYENITDFHYSYILYTPLHGLHESGIVTKLIVTWVEPLGRLDLDTEFSLRLVQKKVGFKAKGGPKPPPVHIPVKNIKVIVEENSEDYSMEDEEDNEENLYWRGDLELYAAVIEPIIGHLDIDEDDSTYKIIGVLKLPQGTIKLDDQFFIDNVFNMKNDLSIETPFEYASEITSQYAFNIDLERSMYLIEDVRIKKYSEWVEAGLNINYTLQKGELDDSRAHMVIVNVKTPLSLLKYINTKTVIEVDENYYVVRVDVQAQNCSASFGGSLEMDEGFLASTVMAKVDSPLITVPRTKVVIKKDLTDKEKRMEFSLITAEAIPKLINLHVTWHVEEQNYVKISVALETWIESLKSLEADVLFEDTVTKNDTAKLNLSLKCHPEQEYSLIGNYRSGSINVHLNTPLRLNEHLKINALVIREDDDTYKIEGNMINEETAAVHKVKGTLKLHDQTFSSLETQFDPTEVDASPNDRITLKVRREPNGIVLEMNSGFLNTSAIFDYANPVNWYTGIKAVALKDDNELIYELETFMIVQTNGNTTVHLYGVTPWEDLERVTLTGNMLLGNVSGNVKAEYELNDDAYCVDFLWKLNYMVDMLGRITAIYTSEDIESKHIDALIFFKNPARSFRSIDSGFDVIVDRETWRLATNASIGFHDKENIDAVVTVRLPPPDNDSHRLLFSYHAIDGLHNASYVIGYNALNAQTNYASDGSIRMAARDIDGHVRLTWGAAQDQTLNNIFNVKFNQKAIDFKYSLFTPRFVNEETVIFFFSYDATPEIYNIFNADIYYPAKLRVGSAHIFYTSLINVNGTINATTPITNFTYVGCNFEVLTTLKQNKRFVELFWPNNTAILSSDYSYHSEKLDSSLEGHLLIEIPLNTRHVGHLTYGYKKRPQVTNGYAELTYNKQKVLHGQYNSKSESRAGFEKDRIQITVENAYKPIGIIYINQYEYSGGNEGTNYPTVEFKQVNVYRLDNSSAFNVAGESRIKTTHTGQDIHLKAVHSNRTVQFKTDYQILPGEFDQHTWLSLADDAWAAYHINILNKTTEDVENQFLVVSFAYPRRNFTLDASYEITAAKISSEARLDWDKDKERPRTLGTSFVWKNVTLPRGVNQQQAILSLKHPSFSKDVTVTGQIIKGDVRDWLNAHLIIDYSLNREKLLLLSAILKDESNLPVERKYSYVISGKHPSTQLNLEIQGSLRKYSNYLMETYNNATYKRSFLPVESGLLNARLDISLNEVELHRRNNDVIKYFRSRYYLMHPEYVVNGSFIRTPDINATGALYLNVREKLTWMMVNYTPDAVESLRMYGNIPDARNAIFNIWRTYDQDLTISDVSFYLKLNHSRLVTSTLRWRPELKSDITNAIKSSLYEMYEETGKDADHWRQYVKSETLSAISGVWEDAEEDMREFLDDWNDLKELETDLEDLKIYLNNSYNSNDFYVKDIVGLGLYVIDELSLRSHIQSLPNILNEIWEIMGESGEAIRNSLLWIIETIKSGYNKILEIVGAVLKGDSVTQIANIIEKLIEKYDMFVKDLHVSFIKYIENLWNNVVVSISQQWNKFLKLVEPTFIQIVHYIEAVIWKASKEVVDFLYDRRNEIIASPYFDRFTNFTQDIDRFYRDVKANDIITNFQKYFGIVVQFFQERYFTIVPFGKELKDVVDEILSELKELKKLPSVKYALDKIQQLYEKAEYLYEYFDVKAKVESTVRLVHSKLIDISQTALQAESRYREAKTKFIFDPHQGLMCLEQKLPMSWHAFNQTPQFQEIPEYRAIADMGSYFVTSNTTFWAIYYRYKPYTEPSNWLPPFKAQALIAGAQHYVTFDGDHYEFSGSCTYLLARDFVRDQFAVLIQYDQGDRGTGKSHRVIVLMGKQAIELDVFKDTVRLMDSGTTLRLPVELENGTAFVYQDEHVVTVERKDKQFKLECNLKFDLCSLELSGWYYGKTAGLLGTMDNEEADDRLASSGRVISDLGQFAQSWSLDGEHCKSHENFAVIGENSAEQFCEDLFVNKSSEFSSCFNVVSPDDYEDMCLNSGNGSEVCTVAMAYMQTCMFYNIYLRIPDRCTTCTMINGSRVPEGEFRKLEGPSVPKSTDVVFIVEAKECNRAINENRSMEYLVTQMSKEFNEQELTENRWSLVTFGGDGVYNEPRSTILDNQIFTKNVGHFVKYFEDIPVGNGNQDIFAAIGFASKLVFRAGVSKTFVLIPCSHCEPQNQTLDYSVLHQVLLERDITLHIFMDGDFQFEKERLNKIFFGLDARKSYTKKDARALVGDTDLRRQVKLSKHILGYCTPLSLETNGTIFSGNKLRFDKLPSIKKFVSVFAKRVALTAFPSTCQHCECTADNNGITQMECMPCIYPTPVTVDYVSETFNEDAALSELQMLNLDYGQMDMEED